MAKPRIILADTDFDYIILLQSKIVEEFFEEAEMEIITEESYFNEMFCHPQTIDVLIVSEKLYSQTLLRHNIANIFVLCGQYGVNSDNSNVTYLYKYSSVKEIFLEIVGRCAEVLKKSEEEKYAAIIMFYSACGGTGKTTIAMGVAMALSRMYKKVLYLNASGMQSFQYLLEDASVINSTALYTQLGMHTDISFADLKKVIRNEGFDYLPPFKAPLTSLGLEYALYRKIVDTVRNSREYEYIVVDTDAFFNEEIAKLLNTADKVVITTNQDIGSVFATNNLVGNINKWDLEKYLFVCNSFKEEQPKENIQAIKQDYLIGEYIEYIETFKERKPKALAEKGSIQRIALSVM